MISKKKDDPTRQKGGRKHPHEAFVRRQRKKALTQRVVSGLLALNDSPMNRQYVRAWHCGNVIEQRDGMLVTQYCKSRVCLVCNGIRTAGLIDAYGPIVQNWERPVLVTLTVPNVPLSELRVTIQNMTRQFANTVRALRKEGHEVKAIRTIEVTGKDARSVHPHLHVLVSSEVLGQSLMEGWLNRYPKAVRSAQDVRRADRGSLKELFKYLTKLTDPDLDPRLLDGILYEMKGLHLVRPIGFRLEKDPADDSVFDELTPTLDAFKRHGEHVFWVWHDDLGNWIDHTTGDILVDTTPPFPTAGFA